MAEGAVTKADAQALQAIEQRRAKAETKPEKKAAKAALAKWEEAHSGNTWRLSKQLEELTGLESRVTILGYVQRGGAPSAADRLLATRLGTACADLINDGVFGVMVASRGQGTAPVPLGQVADRRKDTSRIRPRLDQSRPPRRNDTRRLMGESQIGRSLFACLVGTIETSPGVSTPGKTPRIIECNARVISSQRIDRHRSKGRRG